MIDKIKKAIGKIWDKIKSIFWKKIKSWFWPN